MFLNPERINGWMVIRMYNYESYPHMLYNFMQTWRGQINTEEYFFGFIGNDSPEFFKSITIFQSYEKAVEFANKYKSKDKDAVMMIHPTEQKPNF